MYCDSCPKASFGVLAGATKPNHTAESTSLKPLSSNFVTCGSDSVLFFAGMGNGSQGARLDLPFEIGVFRHYGGDRAGERCIYRRRRPGVWHVSDIGLGIALEKLASDMSDRGRPGTAVRRGPGLRSC